MIVEAPEKPHLSHSQIETFTRCGLQWYRRYVLGEKQPPGVAAVVGKGTHQTGYLNLLRKMDWGQLMSREEVADTARDETVRAWDREQPMINEDDPTKGEAVDLVVALSDLYHRRVAPTIEPIALEQGFRIDVPDLPFDLVGVVDVETIETIRDTKTKGRKPSEDSVRRSQQLALYHLRAELMGEPTKRVAFDYLIKTKTPQHISVETRPGKNDHLALLRRLEPIVASIKAGIFPPADPMSWVCTAKHCGYYDRCEHGARRAVSVGMIDPRRLTAKLIPRPEEDDTADEPA